MHPPNDCTDPERCLKRPSGVSIVCLLCVPVSFLLQLQGLGVLSINIYIYIAATVEIYIYICILL